jgi:hypothetical protein
MHKKITLVQLIDHVLKLSNNESKDSKDDNIQIKSIAAFEEMTFYKLKYGTVKNISDFPTRLKKMLDPFIKNIERISTFDNNDKNTSLYFSILYCIFNNFEELNDTKKIECIDKFQSKLSNDLVNYGLFEKYNYNTLGWKKQMLINSIRNYKNNKMVIRYLAEHLHLNIFIMNIQEDNLYAVYPENALCIHKMNIFLVYYNDIFEPLIYNKYKLWTSTMEPCQKLFNVDKHLISKFNDNFMESTDSGIIQIGKDDLDKYMSHNLRFKSDILEVCDNTNTNINDNDTSIQTTDNDTNINIENQNTSDNYYKEINDSNISEDVTEVCTEKDIVISNAENIFCKKLEAIDIKKLQKMKLDQLQILATKYGISIQIKKDDKTKNKTKAQLIQDIKLL